MMVMNGKRILALVLAVSCVFTLCSCGGRKGGDASGASNSISAASDEKSPSDEGGKSDKSDKKKEKDVTYKTFDDFTRTQRVAAYDIYFDVPVYVETCYRGFISHNSRDYAILVASSKEAQPGISVENDFAEFKNDSFHGIIQDFNNYRCEDYTPDTIDTVTLPCGAEAIKFEGIQPAEFYGTQKEYYIYGYSFVFNDVLLIVSYIVFNDSEVDDATRAELTDYVDRMVQTVRTEE